MSSGPPYDFFIAHAGADKPAAKHLRELLKTRGHAAFVDEDDAPPGALWDELIPGAQRSSRVSLVLVSARSGEGYYNQEEVAEAIHMDRTRGHAVVPIILDASQVPEAMPYGLRRRVALFPERDGWALVVDRLCALVGDFAPPESLRQRLLEIDKAIARKPSDVRALRAERKALRQEMAAGDVLAAGRLFAGRYELEALLGQGGFGQVWRAFDTEERCFVALKILHRDLDQRRCNRFKTGIRKQKDLKHLHIAPVISGPHTEGSRTFAVLALLEGGDLSQALTERRLQVEQVPDLIRAIAQALTCAHDAGVIHRDIKPSNLLLDAEGVVHLTDFDLVRADDTGGESHTRGIGTVLYLAPEALEEDGKVSPATDQYSLAMTAVCLLTGRSLPMKAIYNRQATVRGLGESEAVKAVLLRGIADEPGDRHESIRGFAEALAAALSTGRPIASASDSDELSSTLPGLVMVSIPAGTFFMGSSEGIGGKYEHPQQRVTLVPFLMSATPVTLAQYRAITGQSPPIRAGDDHPVHAVSWDEAVDFCNALSWRDNLQPAYDARRNLVPGASGYRLPSEAQWEYACRAGTTTRWFHGDDEAGLAEYAWYSQNSGGQAQPVGQKKSNAFGLFDMHGNVREWCHDELSTRLGAQETDYVHGFRVARGGSYKREAEKCRSAYRDGWPSKEAPTELGFRVVRTHGLWFHII